MILHVTLLLLAAAGATPPPFDACSLLSAQQVGAIVGGTFKSESKFDPDNGSSRCAYAPPTPSTFGGLDQDRLILWAYTDASIPQSKYLRYHNVREYLDMLARDVKESKPLTGVGDGGLDVPSSVDAGRWILKGSTVFNVSFRPAMMGNKQMTPQQRDAIIRKLEAAVLSGLSH